MMRAMYVRFANEPRSRAVHATAILRAQISKEIERLERAYNTHFNTLWNMVSKAKFALMKRFFETIASRAKHVYDIANRDVESWLKAVMAPLETQVREHHLQLRRRLESIRRIHQRQRRARRPHRRARAGARRAFLPAGRFDATSSSRSTRSSRCRTRCSRPPTAKRPKPLLFGPPRPALRICASADRASRRGPD